MNSFNYRLSHPNNYIVNMPCHCIHMIPPNHWEINHQAINFSQKGRYPSNPALHEYKLIDHGKEPFVVNINQATKQNNTFRTALWTGKHLQVTLMSILPGEDIGLEVHHDVDQFLRIEQGQGLVQMGENKENLNFQRHVYEDSAIMVPAGTWHNITNIGHIPLKLYSIYAPPEHKFGTVHQTKAEAIAAENHHQRSLEK